MARKRVRTPKPVPVEDRLHLTTMKQVAEVLGGGEIDQKALAELTGAGRTAVFNWLYGDDRERQFPARYYKIMNDALQRRGYTADPKLWDQRGDHAAAARRDMHKRAA